MRKKEILPFCTTWMNLKGIMLSEISQRKTNTIRSLLYVESQKTKQNKLTDTESGGCQRQGAGELGEMGRKSQKVKRKKSLCAIG